jgi:hypothetical protein
MRWQNTVSYTGEVMMPWRKGAVLLLGLLAGGCFLPAYQIVSWTATGVSYAFSGKGMGDHALSLAVNKDCATLRLLAGNEICVDYEGDYDDAWSAMASTWKVPQADGVDDADAGVVNSGEPMQRPILALAADVADHEEPSPVILAEFRQPVDQSRTRNPVRGLDFDGLAALGRLTPETRNSIWQSQAPTVRGLDFDGLVKTVRRSPDMPAKTIIALADAAANPVIFLVIGSFSDRSNANRLSAKFSAFRSVVSTVVTDGRTVYRLLTGPLAKSELRTKRAELVRAGIRNSWAVRLCQGSFAAPPCKPALQQASLPPY